MRRNCLWWSVLCWLGVALAAQAASGRVVKVLPLFLDTKGHESLAPSLYERDSYQAHLRQHPELRSGMRFAVRWQAKGPVTTPLKLRLELHGIVQGALPRQKVIEQQVTTTSWLGRWITLPLAGEEYRAFGEVVAWRATLWEGDRLVSEQKSFLW